MPCLATSVARALPRASTVVSSASRREYTSPWMGTHGVLSCRSELPILPGQVVGTSFRGSDSIWLNWKRLGLGRVPTPLKGQKK